MGLAHGVVCLILTVRISDNLKNSFEDQKYSHTICQDIFLNFFSPGKYLARERLCFNIIEKGQMIVLD